MRNHSALSATFGKLKLIDPYLVSLILLISFIGFVSLYSAAQGSIDPWASRQFMRFMLGFILMLCIAVTDIRFLRNHSYTLYVGALLLLIFVEFKGHVGMGAQRWIDLKVFNLQPSEVMKITLIMALANYFHNKNNSELNRIKTYIIPILLVVMPAALVLRQPDLGTVIILAATGAVIIFMAGIRLWKVLTALVLFLGSIPVLWFNMHDYQKKRVLTFLDPESDPLGSGYHIMQSKISIGSGELWGKGFLKGTQSQLQFLPEKQTDFIFAHFCEEFGVFGGSLLITLYALLITVGFKICFESRSVYSRLYSIGFISLFFFYVFINIAMVMGLIPVVGVPLPFMSYGGTAMLSLLFGFGVLLSTHVHRSIRFGRSYS